MPPGTDILDKDGKEHSVHYPMPSGSLHDPLVWKKSYKVRGELERLVGAASPDQPHMPRRPSPTGS